MKTTRRSTLCLLLALGTTACGNRPRPEDRNNPPVQQPTPPVQPTIACGTSAGAACCPGNMCTTGLACNTANGTCQTPVAVQSQPIPAPTPACGTVAGSACCPGNMCTAGLSCGSNGICAAAGTLPPAPNMPVGTQCTTANGQPGWMTPFGCINPNTMPGVTPTLPGADARPIGQIMPANDMASVINPGNPSSFCGLLSARERTTVNETNGRECTLNGSNQYYCSVSCEEQHTSICWRREQGYRVPTDNACEGAPARKVLVLMTREFVDMVNTPSVSIDRLAAEIEQGLGACHSDAVATAIGLREHRFNLHTFEVKQARTL